MTKEQYQEWMEVEEKLKDLKRNVDLAQMELFRNLGKDNDDYDDYEDEVDDD